MHALQLPDKKRVTGLRTSAGPTLTNPSVGAGCRAIVLSAGVCLWRFTFVSIAISSRMALKKTLETAQGYALTLVKFFLAPSK